MTNSSVQRCLTRAPAARDHSGRAGSKEATHGRRTRPRRNKASKFNSSRPAHRAHSHTTPPKQLREAAKRLHGRRTPAHLHPRNEVGGSTFGTTYAHTAGTIRTAVAAAQAQLWQMHARPDPALPHHHHQHRRLPAPPFWGLRIRDSSFRISGFQLKCVDLAPPQFHELH
jgi:hypothetical protein